MILESQLFEKEGWVKEFDSGVLHTYRTGQVWHPTEEAIESLLDEMGFEHELIINFDGRGMWKVTNR